MSCQNCDETKDIAYVRVHKANVGLIGCDEHVGHVLRALAENPYDPASPVKWDRPVIRVKTQA